MKKIINGLIIIGYAWLTIALLYNSILPKEIVDKLPYIDKTTFILSGTFTGVLSSALLYMKMFVKNDKESNVRAMVGLADKVIDIEKQYFKLETFIKEQGNNIGEFTRQKEVDNRETIKNGKLLENVIKLQKLELESRLTNPLLDKGIAEKIKGVLGDEEEVI